MNIFPSCIELSNQRSIAQSTERGNQFSLSAFCGVGGAKWGCLPLWPGRGEVLPSTIFFELMAGVRVPTIFPLLLAWLLPFSTHAELPVGWSTNYPAALAEAATNQKPVLVYFTASWCGPCKLMSRIVLTDPVIMQSLSTAEHVAIDMDQNSELAASFNISVVPTFLLLSPSGVETTRATGFQPATEFFQWLTNGIVEAREAAVQLAKYKDELAGVDRLLASTNNAETAQLASKLFDICAARDPATVQAAVVRLKTLTARDPEAVLDGLKDPRLRLRIQIANALRARLGDTFNVDAWSDSTAREQGIAEWSRRLSSQK